MASDMKGVLSCFLIISLFFQVFAEASLDTGIGISDANVDVVISGKPLPLAPRINCNFACARRCIKASRSNVCNRACGTCCQKCQCVPAGTYGNKNSCPCYASLKTHGQKPKCP